MNEPNRDLELFKQAFSPPAEPGQPPSPQWRSIGEETARTATAFPKIPGFELLEHLGSGGMGAVYKARQSSMDRVVSIKVMRRELAEDPEFVQRFLSEARNAGKIHHENIVGAVDCGDGGGLMYMVMEFVEGRTLASILKGRGILPEREALDWIRQVARGLQAAWEQRIIHRDIKPENILVTKENVAKICDLGLSRDLGGAHTRVTQAGTLLCTPAYASPEQARGERDLDARADIYSLGITLYQLVTGTLPFDADSGTALLVKQVTEPPEPPIRRNPQLSPGVNQLILQMLEKSRNARPASHAEVVRSIDVLLATPPGGSRSRDGSKQVRLAAWLSASVLAAGLITAAVIGAATSSRSPTRPAPEAPRAKETTKSAPAAPEEPPQPAPVPDAAALLDAKAGIERELEADFKEAEGGRAAKKALATKLLTAAPFVEGARRFALLSEAASLAAEALDPTTAFTAIAELGKRFKVDAIPLRTDALEKVRHSIRMGDNERDLSVTYVGLSEKAQAAEDYDLAILLAQEAVHPKVLSEPEGFAGLVHEARERIADAIESRKEYKTFLAADRRLTASPDDAAAMLDQGRYLCLFKGDWSAGARLLARAGALLGPAGDLYLRAGRLEEKPPTEAATQLDLANAWFALAQDSRDPYRPRMARRAVKWFAEAWDSLSPQHQARLAKDLENCQALAGRINLLLTPSKVRNGPGGWRHYGKYLDSPVTGMFNVLEFSAAPPAQFDLEFALNNPYASVAVGAVSTDLKLCVTLSPFSDNSITLSADRKQDSPRSSGSKTFQSGKEFRVLIQARTEGVTVSVNGVTTLRWRGAANEFGLSSAWYPKTTGINDTVFLGHHQNPSGAGGYRIHSFTLIKK